MMSFITLWPLLWQVTTRMSNITSQWHVVFINRPKYWCLTVIISLHVLSQDHITNYFIWQILFANFSDLFARRLTALWLPLFSSVTSQSGRVAAQFTEVNVMTLFTIIKERARNCFFWLVGTPHVTNTWFNSRCSSTGDSKHTMSLTIFRLSSERGLLLRTIQFILQPSSHLEMEVEQIRRTRRLQFSV